MPIRRRRRTFAALAGVTTVALLSGGLLLHAGPRELFSQTTPGSGPTPQAEPAVLVGAGDIGSCETSGPRRTADLLAGIEGTIFTAGDNSQDNGLLRQYEECFEPTWGRFKNRIKPVPGNHDYLTEGAEGYFDYFGQAAGTRGKGYYSYDLGEWHIVALNSNCEYVGCRSGSAQEKWLRADLAATKKTCTAAFWHHPLFTSADGHDPSPEVLPLFQALYDNGAELVVSGHNHVYERFAPQNPRGERDDARGIRQFTVGTGGGGAHYAVDSASPNSQISNGRTYGVLKFTLKKGSYDWRFLPVQGRTFTDSGTATCH